MEKFLVAEMNWAEYEAALKETDTIIIPVGSTEILGPHCPLGSDHIIAHELSKTLGERTGSLVAPAIPVGDALELTHWRGTLSVRPQVLEEYLRDIAASCVNHGLKRIFFFNTHLMNLPAVANIGRDLRRKGILVAQVDWWRLAFKVSKDLMETELVPQGHGSEITTSVMMALRSELVDMSKAKKEKPKEAFDFYMKHVEHSVFTYFDFADYCDYGLWGDPSKSSSAKGQTVISRAVDYLIDFIMAFKSRPLPGPIDR